MFQLSSCMAQDKKIENKRINFDIYNYEIFEVLPEQYKYAKNYDVLKEK